MTPKEKAKELAEKMILEFPLQENTNANVSYIAKQCALIAVNEILFALKYDMNPTSGSIKYWDEVKQEIENL